MNDFITNQNQDLEELKSFAEREDYVKVFNYFHDEYSQMLKDFLTRHDVEVKQDECLIDYIFKTRVFMPEYKDYTYQITSAMYDEDLPQDVKCNMMFDNFYSLKDIFKKQRGLLMKKFETVATVPGSSKWNDSIKSFF